MQLANTMSSARRLTAPNLYHNYECTGQLGHVLFPYSELWEFIDRCASTNDTMSVITVDIVTLSDIAIANVQHLHVVVLVH